MQTKTTPKHYQLSSGREVLDVMEESLSADEYSGFIRGNILKYILRYDKKGGVDDLKKARNYLTKLIELETPLDDTVQKPRNIRSFMDYVNQPDVPECPPSELRAISNLLVHVLRKGKPMDLYLSDCTDTEIQASDILNMELDEICDMAYAQVFKDMAHELMYLNDNYEPMKMAFISDINMILRWLARQYDISFVDCYKADMYPDEDDQ